MMQIIFAIAIALFAHDAIDTQTQFNYIQIRDVRDATNNYQNMRETIELCYRINATQQSIDQCAQRAYDIAISIDA
jgi:hypothetical protein